MRDMLSNMQVVRLGKQTLSGTTPNASAWVDTLGFDSCTLVLTTDTVTDAGTAAGFTATLQHSDSTAASSAAAAAAGDSANGVLTLTVTADADDNKVIGGIGYNGTKRYARFNIVGTTNTDAVVEVYAILENAHRAKTTFVGASVAAT